MSFISNVIFLQKNHLFVCLCRSISQVDMHNIFFNYNENISYTIKDKKKNISVASNDLKIHLFHQKVLKFHTQKNV